jgi:hypothetical protein
MKELKNVNLKGNYCPFTTVYLTKWYTLVKTAEYEILESASSFRRFAPL